MLIFARVNHIGWIHLWRSREAFEAGEASEQFFDPKVDPRWAEVRLDPAGRASLAAGELVALEDPGYLASES